MIETQTTSELAPYELTLMEIVRKLPSDRVVQLIDFAHFLELQTQKSETDNGPHEKVKTVDEVIDGGQDKWDELLARPDAKSMMRKMAGEALAEYRAGQTTDIRITEDGRLAPA